MAEGVRQARADWEARRNSGVDQAALDQAAREGTAQGAFEESAEEAIAIVEEFFPEDEVGSGGATAAGNISSGKAGVAEKLAAKLNINSEP